MPKKNITSTLFPGFENVLIPASEIPTLADTFKGNSKSVTLVAPPDKEIKRIINSGYRTKDDLWRMCNKIINDLQNYNINWSGNDKDIISAKLTVSEVMLKKAASLKSQLEAFYAVMYYPENEITLCKLLITGRALNIAMEMVEKGAVSEDYVYEFMGWGKPPERYSYSYYSYSSDKRVDKWVNSSETSFLSTLCSTVRGYKESKYSGKYLDNTRYFIPSSTLIRFILSREIEGNTPVETLPEDVKVFDGMDYVPMADMTLGLILSGTVKANKTKAGLSAVKKISSLVPFAPFPPCYQNFPSRAELIANMAFFGQNDGILDKPGKKCSNSEMLRNMYNVLDLKYLQFDTFLIADVVGGVTKDTYYENGAKIVALANVVREDLSLLEDGKWRSFSFYKKQVSFDYASLGNSFMIPVGYRSSTDRFNINGKVLPISGLKLFFHDYLIEAIILGIAAIGGLDIAFGKEGTVDYIRLTEVGKWYIGKLQTFPQIKVKVSDKPDFEADEITGMIIVANPKSNYLAMLPDFAEKVTEKRYAISPSKFLADCSTAAAVEEKINRFKSFILPEPGKKIEAILSKILSDCNKVKKTPGASTYQLVDVNASDSRLHSLILNDPEIKKNILKVEGCRLLVKTAYLPKLAAKLKKEGYLTEL